MLKPYSEFLIIFLIVTVILILMLAIFVIIIIYKYKQKQNVYYKELEELKINHENALLQTQLEIQEQTFQNISREIHDNIGQKLTLAKLNLNTLPLFSDQNVLERVNDSVAMISESIADLSDVARSMGQDIILNNGLIKAIEFEISHLQKSGLYEISFSISDNTAFLEGQQELILFRIVQESLHNIIKHAEASCIIITLDYTPHQLSLEIKDNGKGFDKELKSFGNGLSNIKNRAAMINGKAAIESSNIGTSIKINLPIPQTNQHD